MISRHDDDVHRGNLPCLLNTVNHQGACSVKCFVVPAICADLGTLCGCPLSIIGVHEIITDDHEHFFELDACACEQSTLCTPVHGVGYFGVIAFVAGLLSPRKFAQVRICDVDLQKVACGNGHTNGGLHRAVEVLDLLNLSANLLHPLLLLSFRPLFAVVQCTLEAQVFPKHKAVGTFRI